MSKFHHQHWQNSINTFVNLYLTLFRIGVLKCCVTMVKSSLN